LKEFPGTFERSRLLPHANDYIMQRKDLSKPILPFSCGIAVVARAVTPAGASHYAPKVKIRPFFSSKNGLASISINNHNGRHGGRVRQQKAAPNNFTIQLLIKFNAM